MVNRIRLLYARSDRVSLKAPESDPGCRGPGAVYREAGKAARRRESCELRLRGSIPHLSPAHGVGVNDSSVSPQEQ